MPAPGLPRFAVCARIATITDLSPFALPHLYGAGERRAIDATVRRAQALIVPSTTIAAELASVVDAAAKPVHVTPAGVDPHFRPLDPEQCMEAVQERYGLPSGYLLSIGQAPAKNRNAILRSLRQLLDAGRDVHVAFVGDEGSSADKQMVAGLNLEQHVHFCGYVPQADLPLLYNAASLMLQPSLHDGIALTVLEAMACGTPLITSDRSTPLELADDAAILVDPGDVTSICAAVCSILDDPALVSRLRFSGIKRAAEFSWEACAELTVAVYDQVLSS
jgi:glycosyltransferase involved in cell wall biosynthesis